MVVETTLKAATPETLARVSTLPSQYVDAIELLKILFVPESRPSLRWLRDQQAARKIPSVKIGRLVFFDPLAVKAALDARAKGGRG